MFVTRASDGRHQHPSRTSGRRVLVVRAAQVIAAALSALLLAGFGYAWHAYRSLQNHAQTIAVTTPTTTTIETPVSSSHRP